MQVSESSEPPPALPRPPAGCKRRTDLSNKFYGLDTSACHELNDIYAISPKRAVDPDR